MSFADFRDVTALVGASLLSYFAVEPLTAAGNELWATNDSGVLWTLFDLVPLVGLDEPVTLVVGVLLAWLGLFLIDATKRIQAALVVVVLIFFQFLPFLQSQGLVLPAIGRAPIPFVFGLVVGFATGVFGNRLYDTPRPEDIGRNEYLKRWIQFPAATGWLLYSIIGLVLITGLDYVALHPGQSARVETALSSVVLAGSAFVFFRFDYQQHVTVISPPDVETQKYHPFIIGGVFNGVESLGTSRIPREITNKPELFDARGAQHFDDLPTKFNNKPVTFGFVASAFDRLDRVPSALRQLLDTLFLRPVVVESDGWTTSDIVRTVTPGSERVSRATRLNLAFADAVQSLVPVWIRNRDEYRGGDVLNRLNTADVILLAAPLLAADEATPPGIQRHRELLSRYGSGVQGLNTDIVLVVTQAQRLDWNAPNSTAKKATAVRRLDLEAGTDGSIPFDEVVLVDRWPEYGFTPTELNDEVDEDQGLLFRLF